MPIQKVSCPHCQAVLKTARAMPLGKQVKCPRCQQPFAVGSESIQAAPARSASAQAPSPILVAAPALGEFSGPSRSAAGRSGKRGRVLAWLLAGSLLFLGTGAGLAYYCFSGGKTDASKRDERASGNESGAPNRGNPGSAGTTVDPNHMGGRTGEPLTSLPAEEQKEVDLAVQRGTAWLKAQGKPSGSWTDGDWQVGYAAFPALTLLMCDVPATDPVIQNAAKFVRAAAPQLTKTYELSLAIWFFDRLGDPQDQELIKTFAARLVAGQSRGGGWTYDCPLLSPQDGDQLIRVLQGLRSQDSSVDIARSMVGDKLQLSGGEGTKAGDSKLELKGPVQPETLPGALRDLPVLQQQKLEGDDFYRRGPYDHSNTQFAVLALWIAGHYKVPLDRTLAMVSRHFRTCQQDNGGWGYDQPRLATTPPMTCAGLLGLAVGHGLASDMRGAIGGVSPLKDPAVQRGLQELGKSIGEPQGRGVKIAVNLYFLWSLERVAVVFSLSKIGDKDWYHWGSQILVANQGAAGNWTNGAYWAHTDVIDTCMALLFLKRANVVSDLTDKLQLFTDASR